MFHHFWPRLYNCFPPACRAGRGARRWFVMLQIKDYSPRMDNPLTHNLNLLIFISQTTQLTWWICGDSWKSSILGPRSWVWSKILREFWVTRSLPLWHKHQIAVVTRNKHATDNKNPSFQDDVSWLSWKHTGVIPAKSSLFCSPRRARVSPKQRNPAGFKFKPNLWLRPREIPPTKMMILCWLYVMWHDFTWL